MKREEVLALLEEFKGRLADTDCGAILIISATTGGPTDIDIASNLQPVDQVKVYEHMLAKLRGAQ